MGLYKGLYRVHITGLVKGDTRSLDCSACGCYAKLRRQAKHLALQTLPCVRGLKRGVKEGGV